MGEKTKTAVDGNAPGGPDFRDARKPLASGQNANLGDQVRPETQTNEDDGHRTLARPRLDPGPDLKAHGHDGWRNPGRGETLNGVNEPRKIMQRTSTRNDDKAVTEQEIGAHVVGAETLASDVYNPERGEGLTDRAVELAARPRELAPGAAGDAT